MNEMSDASPMLAQVVDDTPTYDLAQTGGPPTLYGTTDPSAILTFAAAQATALKKVVDDQKLYVVTGKDRDGTERRHVQVEGWQTLGTLLGVFPVVRWTRPTPDFRPRIVETEWKTVEDDEGRQRRRKFTTVKQEGRGGWVARAEAVTMNGVVIGAAEMECRYEEETWRTRDSYALMSMAETRAQGKCLRGSLSFVMALAGYQVTPLEEIPDTPAYPAIPIDEPPTEMNVTVWAKKVAVHLAGGHTQAGAALWRGAMDRLEYDHDLELDRDEAIAVVETIQATLEGDDTPQPPVTQVKGATPDEVVEDDVESGTPLPGPEGYRVEDLEQFTKAELRNLASRLKVEFTASDTKGALAYKIAEATAPFEAQEGADNDRQVTDTDEGGGDDAATTE